MSLEFIFAAQIVGLAPGNITLDAQSVLANPTGAAAVAQSLTVATNSFVGRAAANVDDLAVADNSFVGRGGTDLGGVAVAVQSLVMRGAGSLAGQAIGTNEIVGRAGGNLGALPVGAQSVLMRAAADIVAQAVGVNELVGRQGGDLGVVSVALNTLVGRLGGVTNLDDIPVPVQSLPLRGSGDLTIQAIGTNEILGRSGADLGGIGVPPQTFPFRGSADFGMQLVNTNEIVGRAGGDLGAIAMAAQSLMARAAANISPIVATDGSLIGKNAAGDLGNISLSVAAQNQVRVLQGINGVSSGVSLASTIAGNPANILYATSGGLTTLDVSGSTQSLITSEGLVNGVPTLRPIAANAIPVGSAAGTSITSLTIGAQALLMRAAADVVAQTINTNELVGRAAGSLGGIPVTVQSIPLRGAADLVMQAIATDEIVGRAGGNLGPIAMGAQSILMRRAANIVAQTINANEVVMRSGVAQDVTGYAVAINSIVGRQGGDLGSFPVGVNELVGRSGANLTTIAIVANNLVGRLAGDLVSIGYPASGLIVSNDVNALSGLGLATNEIVARIAGTTPVGLAVAAQSLPLRGAADLVAQAVVDGQVIGRLAGGNLGPVSTVSASTVNTVVARDAAGRSKFVSAAAAGDAAIYEQVQHEIADPGTGVAIPVTSSGTVPIVTGAAPETNTLAAPTFLGQELVLCMDVDGGGNRAVTAASAINIAGNTIMTFGEARDTIVLKAIRLAGVLAWEVVANNGVALT